MGEQLDRPDGRAAKWGLFHEQLINLFPRLLELFDDKESAQEEADKLNEQVLAANTSEAGPEEQYFVRALSIGGVSVETTIKTVYLDFEGNAHSTERSTTDYEE